MVVRRQKRSRKLSGGHGYGEHKKHRGSGHKGGKGRAGSKKHGRMKETKNPGIISRKGFSGSPTTKDQSVVVGTLQNIVEKAKDVPTPALIVVGRVVELRDQLKWFEGHA